MSQTSTQQIPQLKSRIGAILRATSGNFLEQLDFFLFGFYASAIAKAFFLIAVVAKETKEENHKRERRKQVNRKDRARYEHSVS